MRAWALILGGLIVWAVQFFTLYVIASIFPDSVLARAVSAIVTIAAVAADILILRLCVRFLRSPGRDEFDTWMLCLALLGAGISLVAIVWQGLPAVLA